MNSSKGTHGVLTTIALLTPWDVVGCGKIRIGGDHDGGYVMLDRLRPEQPVLSYGVGPDVSFDLDLAKRGHPVFMFDHTVDGPSTVLPPNALFTREGVAVRAQPKKSLGTIESHLRRHKLVGRRDIILKMDIEGAEWPVLSALPDALLNVFEQIVVEFHWLGGLNQKDFAGVVRNTLQRLNTHFTICHVHANNYAGISLVEGVVVPTVIEVTYIRRRLIRRSPSQTLFPTRHDRSNNPAVKDVVLSMYPFLPMARPATVLSPIARRLDAEYAAWAAPIHERNHPSDRG
ncbi:MAG: FkbM family methyltransferase, partial [Alphaproteobacteria bacterium]